jgi:hypothetical protein
MAQARRFAPPQAAENLAYGGHGYAMSRCELATGLLTMSGENGSDLISGKFGLMAVGTEVKAQSAFGFRIGDVLGLRTQE